MQFIITNTSQAPCSVHTMKLSSRSNDEQQWMVTKGLEALAKGLEVAAKMCINGPTGKWGSIRPNKWVCIW